MIWTESTFLAIRADREEMEKANVDWMKVFIDVLGEKMLELYLYWELNQRIKTDEAKR